MPEKIMKDGIQKAGIKHNCGYELLVYKNAVICQKCKIKVMPKCLEVKKKHKLRR